MAILYLILALIVAVVAVIFAWQNAAIVTITFFTLKVENAPLSLVLLVTLAIGILIGWLFAAPSLVKHTFRASSQRRRIGVLELELEEHKNKLSELQKPAPAAPKPVTPLPAQPSPDQPKPPQQPS